MFLRRLTSHFQVLLTIQWMAALFFLFSCSSDNRYRLQAQQMLSAAIAIEDSDAVAALNYYEQTLDLLIVHPDSLLLRETFFRMGILFMRWSLPDECVDAVRQAFIIDSLQCDTASMVKSLRSMAFAFESSGQIEKARIVASNRLCEDIYSDNQLLKNLNYDSYARYVDMQAMKDSLPADHVNEMSHLTPLSSELELAHRGWMAERYGKTEEAVRLYRRLSGKRSLYVRGFAQLHLSRLLLSSGKIDEANVALDNYEATNALIRKGEQTTKQLLQVHARYQDRRQKQEISRLLLLTHHQWQTIIISLVVSVVVIVILLLSIRVYRQRQVILRFKVDKLRQWREAYLKQSEEEKAIAIRDTRQTGIYQSLRVKLNGGDTLPMRGADWQELEAEVLKRYPNFKLRLCELCRLSDHDYHVCLLLKIGIKPSEIARLTIRSDEAISSTRRRLYERAFGMKGKPTDWDEVVKAIA